MSDEAISKKFMSQMKKVGVESLDTMLLYLPAKYQDYRLPEPSILACKATGKKSYLKLKLTKRPEVESPSSGPARAKLMFTDGQTTASAMAFGAAFGWKSYKEGDFVHVTGTVGDYNGWTQIQGVELVPIGERGRIVPRYKGKEKVLNPKSVAEKMAVALREFADDTVNHLVEEIGVTEGTILKHSAPEFQTLKQVLYALHRPKSHEQIEKANKAVRMINAYHALMMSMQSKKLKPIIESQIEYDVDLIKDQLKGLPFALTGDQKRTIWDITKDLNSYYPMDRLVSGDVGCGKTLSYALPAACAHLNGAKVAIIMPNLLLASQVAGEIKEMFTDTDVQLMLGGASRPKGKLKGNPIIVGTTAILWWLKDINHEHELDLLIIDEQQKLGVEQKNALISAHTNVLEATATAIPRTAAAVLYGNKKVSLIEECPVDKSIKTRIVGSDEKRRVFEELLQITREGAQIAVLYPIRKHNTGQYDLFIPDDFDSKSEIKSEDINDVINEHGGTVLSTHKVEPSESTEGFQPTKGGVLVRYRNKHTANKKVVEALDGLDELGLILLGEVDDPEEMDLCKRSVESAANHWERHFPGQVVMIHGGLNVKQKLAAIEEAKNGNCKVIVTSSVIEIGLTMPDLRGLLILESNNYGASTLHQFRGRLARKGGNGTCYLGVDCPVSELDPDSKARLNLLVKYTKGSQIAEDDMRQRGFGDLSKNSVKQAGFMDGLFKGLKMTPQDVDALLAQGLDASAISPVKTAA